MRNKILFMSLILLGFVFAGMAKVYLADVSAELVRQTNQATAPKGTSGGLEQSTGLLTEAKLSIISIIQQNSFDEARVLTRELISNFSGHPDLPGALYEIAASECEWRPELAEEAKSIYQQIVNNHPDSLYASKAKLGILRADVLSPIMSQDYNGAEKALAQLIADYSKHPDFPETLYWLARAYDRQLKMEFAKGIYQQIIQNHPDSSWAGEAKLGIARAEVMSLILLNEHIPSKEALAQLIADFNDHPNFPETLYWVAERYRWAREYGEAKSIYKQIIQNHSDSSWAGRAKIGISRAEALSFVNSENSNRLEETVDKLIVDFNDHPDLPETLYWIAQECEWMIKLKEANSIYQRVIDCCPEGYWADKARLGISRVNVGADIEKGDITAAEPAFDKLIVDFNDHPDMAWALYWIAKRYEGQGEFEKAKQLYNQIIKQYPDSEYAGLIQIDIPVADILSLIRSGERAKAMEAIDTLIADFNDNPNLPQTLFMLGEDYYNKALQYEDEGLTDQATASSALTSQAKANFTIAASVWDKIITHLPKSKPAIVQHAYYFVALCCRNLGEHEKAIQYFQKVVDNWPDYQYAWSAQCLIGECYEKLWKSGNMPESEAKPLIERAYKAVIEKYPDCSLVGHACLKLAEPLILRGQWAEVAQYYELFLQKRPNDPERVDVLYDLGQTYEKMGQPDSAAQVYSVFVETADPNDQRIETAKAKLEELEGTKK